MPRGFLGNHSANAGAPESGRRSQWRISGPLLDRLDIQIEVPALAESELLSASTAESSSAIRARV